MKFIIFLFFFLLTVQLFAQQSKTSLSGTVVDKTSQRPIQFVSVTVMHPSDSAIVTGTVTDKKGKFFIQDITEGNYIIRYSYIGYDLSNSQLLTVTNQQGNINVGTIAMSNSSKELNEVIVTGKKSLLKTSIDRKIYQVDQDIMSKSGAASDILKNIPSVEIDIEGNVSLRGSGDVMILINGRPSPLMGKNRAEALQQLPANSIERIEVITNPSARFRPDGTSGIINIVLKKNSKAGFNGMVIGNAGNRERSNGSLNLNFNSGKLNTFIIYSIRQDERNRYNQLNRTYYDSSTGTISGYYEEKGKLKARPLSHLLRAGIDYTIDEQNSIGISGNNLWSSLTRNNLVNRYYSNSSNQLTNQFDRTRHAPATEDEKDATIYWQHNFNKEGHELRVEATASSQSEDEKTITIIFLISLPSDQCLIITG